MGFGSFDGIAREQVLLGERRPDSEGPDEGAAVTGDDAYHDVGVADHDVGVADAGGLGDEDDVARRRDRGAEPHGTAVDRGDDRDLDVDVEHVPDQVLAFPAESFEPSGLLQTREAIKSPP